MIRDDSSELLNQLRTWIEEQFQSLHATFSEEEDKGEARARYRKLTSIIHQLEGLGISIPEDVESEKAALEEFLHTPNEEENKLAFLSGELSSLARDINDRLRGLRSQTTRRGKRTISKRLRVGFSDGTIIDEPISTHTYVDVIRHMGLQRVSELPIKKNGVSLVSIQEPESPKEAEKFRKVDGYFINTHSSTKSKARYIQRIADALQIDISVSIVD